MQVNGQHYRTIWQDPQNDRRVCIIDQRQLPHRFVVETVTSSAQMIAAIGEMHVRGAGLIGAAAAYAVYLATLEAPDSNIPGFLEKATDALRNSRPTARNLQWAVDRVMRAIAQESTGSAKRRAAKHTAAEIADEDALFCRRIGQHGLALIEEISRRKKGKEVNILTHCNAGWLAFVDYGSATAPIYAARDAGIPVHVWVDETRPWNQGARLTAWELQQEGIANTLIADNCGGHLMQQGMVDLVLVGSDRTTHTGDVANKIGTYLKALAAHDNAVPFYVALPSSTLDWELDFGRDIPIEQRSAEEITSVFGCDEQGMPRTITLSAPGTRAANYGFDITPARLVTGLITERGVVKATREEIHRLFPEASGAKPRSRQPEKRRFIRFDALHLLDYLELDREGNPGSYSMGRTIDVSHEGIKLETAYPIAAETRLLITLGLEDELVDLEGRTTHARPHDGRYLSGVTFLEISQEGRRILSRYVKAFRALQKRPGAV